MREFGVTRLARVTGLDFVGIPVWAAIRPNSKTLAQSQGKGIDDDAAQASALMEAIEVACAERTDFETVRASPAELVRFGATYDRLDGLLRGGSDPIDDDETIEWIEGFDLLRNRPKLVPLEAATLRDAETRPRYWQTTDGLASGNLLWEAALHGLCERIERDAIAMWLFRDDDEIAARCVDTRSFADPVLDDLRRKIERAGLRLRLFDASCDSGAPVFCAFISPSDVKHAERWKHFDLSSGWGCHPTALRAAIRAVTEAAQTRVTTISAARDDFEPARYEQEIDPSLLIYARARPVARRDLAKPAPLARDDYVAVLLDRLRGISVKSVILIPLERGQRGFAVATRLRSRSGNPAGRSTRPARAPRAALPRRSAMKILFVGPTLHDLVESGCLTSAPSLRCSPPAIQGDIARATKSGANVIGLVDGRYEDVAAPWHKEILFAIEEGVTVLGAGSLGALRAAECAAFGMIGVGDIFRRYLSGELVDDSDVAQCHAPAELGNFPTTEALVNVEATIFRTKATGEIDAVEASKLAVLARRIFFKQLTFEQLASLRHPNSAAAAKLVETLNRNRVDAKRADALELVAAMSALPDARDPRARAWRLAQPRIWKTFIEGLSEGAN